MRYTTLLFLFSFSLSFSLTSCSSGDDGDEPTNPTPTNPTERKLIIGVSANPWLDENGNARETRGSVITTQTLKDFTINFWQYSEKNSIGVSRVGNDVNNSWIPTPKNDQGGTWPSFVGNNDPISFYAHTAGTCNYASGNYYVAFNSEEASGFQHDLLLSKITDVTYSETGGVIWFTFDHACAAVEFNIQITNKLIEKLNGSQLIIDSVRLVNIAKTGDCYYSTNSGNHVGEWRDVREYTKYTLNTAQFSVTNEPHPLECNTMFVIPQTLGENAMLEVKYNFPNRADSIAKISLKDIKWEAGHLYPINIVLGTTLIK